MLCLAALAFCRCDDKRVTVGDLTVEMLENPVGLDERTPRFGWQLRSDLRDVAQTSYRIVVAGSENDLKKEQNLIWDSGEVPSGESVWVEYGGPQLESRKDYFWKVRVTTNTGDETWSEPARWSMGPLCEEDWGRAEWIAARDEETWRNEWAEHKRRDVENREPNTWATAGWRLAICANLSMSRARSRTHGSIFRGSVCTSATSTESG